jgi:C-terminal processing protease CtpA/Prc
MAIAVANGDFETGAAGDPPPHWSGTTTPGSAKDFKGYRSVLDPENPRSGKASVRLEHIGGQPAPNQFGMLASEVDAAPYRGKRIRLTGAVRVRDLPGAQVGLWLRVDRPERRMGFFDNMGDRPIRNAEWADYQIEGDVAPDAERIVFGLLLAGPGAAWLDDVRLEVLGPARDAAGASATGAQRPRTRAGAGDEAARPIDAAGLRNLKAFARLYGYLRYFHPSDQAAAADWDGIALAGVQQVERARGPAQLAAALNLVFKPVAPTFDAFVSGRAPAVSAVLATRPSENAKALRWRHHGIGEDRGRMYKSVREEVTAIGADSILTVDLGGGVSARVPLAVWRDDSGKTVPAVPAPQTHLQKPAGFTPSGFDRTTRLADIVIAWNVFQHFYAYFDVIQADWPAELDKGLRAAATDKDDFAFHRTLRRLIAGLKDGHGNVAYASEARGYLPLAWEVVEGRLVVTAVGEGVSGIRRGDIVTHVDGVAVERLITERSAHFSGSPQWVRQGALFDLSGGKPGASAELRLAGATGRSGAVRLAYKEAVPGKEVKEAKPAVIADIAPGIIYIDLDRVTDDQMRAREKDIVAARGLVFDVRGYPKGMPWYLGRLTDRPIKSAAMEIPIVVRPDRQGVTFSEGGWDIKPETPRFTTNTVFITNGSAISYAESVLGSVAGNRLADIVGEPSAGANGNVASIQLPGGYRIAWTGMRVRNRDGSPHHVVGVRPTVPASRTIAGVRAGRDEMLERALALVKSRLGGSAAGR